MNISTLLSHSTDLLSRIHNLKKEDIHTLREVIREHNRLYYQEESPLISDLEYDQLYHGLARAEVEYGDMDPESPTAHIAVLASAQFKKVSHKYPMISLDNTYSVSDVRDWHDRMMRILQKETQNVTPPNLPLSEEAGSYQTLKHSNTQTLRYYVQPKYDGLGLAVVYEYGILKQAITRGSGVEGEDVTLTALEIQNLPKEIGALGDIPRMEIRGEVMMSRTVFDQVNRERLMTGDKLFANPRNCASGSLRQLDPLITRSRRLQFFAYSIPSIEQGDQSSEFRVQSYSRLMDTLASWGFEREDFVFKNITSIEDLCTIIERETDNRREYFDIDIDGMVLKLDDMTLWDVLGRTEHHPRYAIAYKFPAKQVRTTVLSIEHSVGRTGTITPVANLDPVEVTGVVVRRATLHNYDELTKKDVRIGDQVWLVRAGEVIPEIVSVIEGARTGHEEIVEIPQVCPICQTPVYQDDGKVALYCPNSHCPAQIQGQLEMFVGKQGMNIDGLGVKQIELFVSLGWIMDLASVFDLGIHRDEMLTLEGYREKSIQNLIDSLEKARHTTLDRVLTAIGIPNVGKKTAKQLAVSSYQLSLKNQASILEILFILTEEDLLSVRDIGPETARTFVEYMRENRELVERLFEKLDIQLPNKNLQSLRDSSFAKELEGKSYCVTGSFEGISRDQIHEWIEAHGGEVRTAVTRKLDYLIVGSDAGSKAQKALELGVKCVSWEEVVDGDSK